MVHPKKPVPDSLASGHMDSGATADELALAREDLVLVDAVASGDPSAVDAGIRYLEADPWRFRSGYVKQRLLSNLRRYDLDTRQRARLTGVLLRYVDIG